MGYYSGVWTKCLCLFLPEVISTLSWSEWPVSSQDHGNVPLTSPVIIAHQKASQASVNTHTLTALFVKFVFVLRSAVSFTHHVCVCSGICRVW